MIKLHVFPTGPEIPNYSPACMKLETWLRLAKLPYEIVTVANPGKAPKGKLPYIVDGNDTVPDSEAIIAWLSKKYEIDLDENLSVEEKAVARAFERMLNEHAYFGLLFARWIDPPGWAQVKAAYFGGLPPGLRQLVPAMLQRSVRRDLRGQGLGRHTPDEIYARIAQDLQAVSDYLGDQPFFMGREPTTIDASVYAFVGNCIEADLKTPLTELAVQHANLVDYCARMRQRCFPESKK